MSCGRVGVCRVLDMEAATVLRPLLFLLLRILFFMCISHPGSSLGSVRDLFCLLQQVTVLCLVFLVYEMVKTNPLQNSLTTNIAKGREATKRQRLVVTVNNYIASETSFLVY